jgi:hypothetical protein
MSTKTERKKVRYNEKNTVSEPYHDEKWAKMLDSSGT